MPNPKILIIGHARHGKDTVAEMLRDEHDYNFVSSSEFVGREIIWEQWGKDRYASFEEMFEDRVNHRKLWADMITDYNTPDKTKTATTMLSRGHDMYVGMRRRAELEACVAAGVFDIILWVDRSQHLPDEKFESMEMLITDADHVIDNNGTLEDLRDGVAEFAYRVLGKTKDTKLEVLNLLQHLKEEISTDADTQVSAVITTSWGKVLTAGANCHTHGLDPTAENSTRPVKYDYIEHAERNAIFAAAMQGTSLQSAEIYIEGFPCVECARAIVQSGIRKLYHGSTDGFDPVKYKFDLAREILEVAEVELEDWSGWLDAKNTPPADVS
jgi:deoxycytidylate deaminase